MRSAMASGVEWGLLPQIDSIRAKLDPMGNQLSDIQRLALWTAHSKKCTYCGEPLKFAEMDIDHILPASLSGRPEELAKLTSRLSVPSDFRLDSLKNLLPTHRSCNQRKRDQVFNESTARYFLAIAEQKYEAITNLASKLELEASLEKLLTLVQSALRSGDVEMAQLLDAATNTSGFPLHTTIEFESGVWDVRADPGQVDKLLDEPVTLWAENGRVGVAFKNENGDEISVRTCREYRTAVSSGFYPSDNTQLKMSFLLVTASAILEAAARAKLAAVSHFRSLRKSVMGADKEDPQLTKPDGLELSLTELMRADFDGDGIEEILVLQRIYATAGTFRALEIGLLRKAHPQSEIEYSTWSVDANWAQAQRKLHMERMTKRYRMFMGEE